MPERDIYHNIVRAALIAEGWNITHDPLIIQFEDVQMYADLGAEKIIAAQKAECKIAVEIKSFLSPSPLTDFHLALGQFINYRSALADQEPDRTLYLAIPVEAHERFFTRAFARKIVKDYDVKVIVYDPQQEVIVKWQE